MSTLPVVAVVGRPNVGKSTLVNRIVGGRAAVVEERPGVTRDRRQFDADWAGRRFILVDTGGWETKPGDDVTRSIREQAEAAVNGADLVLLVVDGTTELSDDDTGVLGVLRSSRVPVLLAANKADSTRVEADLDHLWRLGLGRPFAVSAYHGRGVGDLLDAVVAGLPEPEPAEPESAIPRIAIVGRPNVGKSTLLNRLVGEERVIVSDRPGTTRDPIDVEVVLEGRRYLLVDTAGIRRRPQITEDADFYAVLRAREAVAQADVAVLLLDATEGATHQDQRIAREVVDAGTGLVVLVNKWDAVTEEERQAVERSVADRLGFVGWAPTLKVAALTGSRLSRLPAVIHAVTEARQTRISTGVLNRLVRDWVAAHPAPTRRGRRPKVHYAVQAGTAPPTFVVFVSGGELGEDYLRFLENRLRREADFTGNPIRMVTRSGRAR